METKLVTTPPENARGAKKSLTPVGQLFTGVLRSFAAASQACAIYPTDHPLLLQALETASQSVAALLKRAESVSATVMRDKLLVDEQTFGVSELPCGFAIALANRDVASIRFSRGLAVKEVQTFLRLLSASTEQGSRFAEELQKRDVKRIVVTFMDFRGILQTSGDPQDADGSALSEDELWQALASVSASGGGILASGSSIRGLEQFVRDPARVRRLVSRAAAGDLPDRGRVPTGKDAAALAEVLRKLDAAVETMSPAAADDFVKNLTEAVFGLGPEVCAEVVTSTFQTAENETDVVGRMRRSLSDTRVTDLVVSNFRLERQATPRFRNMVAALAPSTESKRKIVGEIQERLKTAQGSKELALLTSLSSLLRGFSAADEDAYVSKRYESALGTMRSWSDGTAGHGPQSAAAELLALKASVDVPAVRSNREMLLLDLLDLEDDSEDYAAHAWKVPDLFRDWVRAGKYMQAKELVELVVAHAGDSDSPPWRQEAASTALSQMSSSGVLTDMAVDVADGQGETRQAVLDILRAFGISGLNVLLDALARERRVRDRRKLIDVIAALEPQDISPIVKRLNDHRWYVVRNMMLLLGELGNQDAPEAIAPQLPTADVRVCKEAIRALARVGGDRAAGLIVAMLEHDNVEIRLSAIRNASEACGVRAVPALVRIAKRKELLRRNDPERIAAVQALGRIGSGDAVPVLADILTEKTLWARASRTELVRNGAAALAQIRTPSARAVLEEGVGAKPKVQREACSAALANCSGSWRMS